MGGDGLSLGDMADANAFNGENRFSRGAGRPIILNEWRATGPLVQEKVYDNDEATSADLNNQPTPMGAGSMTYAGAPLGAEPWRRLS